MPASVTHNAWLVRPPPGAVFQWTLGSSGPELELVFERGKEAEVIAWMHGWLAYLERQQNWVDPRIRDAVISAKGKADPNGNLTTVRAAVEDVKKNPGKAAASKPVTQPTTVAKTETIDLQAVCECGEKRIDHHPTQPHPQLQNGCGAFKPVQ